MKLRFRLLLVLVCLGLGCNILLRAKAQSPEVEKPKSYRGLVASLSIDKEEYRSGENMEATITFTANTEPHRLFNPFFNGLLEQPGRILIRDSTGKVVRRIFDFHLGSRRSAGKGDYVLVYSKCFVGKRVTINPSRGVVENWMENKPLPPGKYSIQLILYGLLFSFGGKDNLNVAVTSERIPFNVVGG